MRIVYEVKHGWYNDTILDFIATSPQAALKQMRELCQEGEWKLSEDGMRMCNHYYDERYLFATYLVADVDYE